MLIEVLFMLYMLKKCCICGSEFESNKSITCSVECSIINRKQKQKVYDAKKYKKKKLKAQKEAAKIKYTKECIICKKVFITTLSHKKTCSESCSKYNAFTRDFNSRNSMMFKKEAYVKQCIIKKMEEDTKRYNEIIKIPGYTKIKELNNEVRRIAKRNPQLRKNIIFSIIAFICLVFTSANSYANQVCTETYKSEKKINDKFSMNYYKEVHFTTQCIDESTICTTSSFITYVESHTGTRATNLSTSVSCVKK